MLPLLVLSLWSRYTKDDKQVLLDHYHQISALPAYLKYAFVFSIEGLVRLAHVPFIPESQTQSAEEHYNQEVYAKLARASEILDSQVAEVFSSYDELYKNVIFKDACASMQSPAAASCKANSYLVLGAYISFVQVLSRSNDAYKQLSSILSSSDSQADKTRRATRAIQASLEADDVGSPF